MLVALAYHNAQLQASAFREEFDPEAFEDLTRPKYDMIHRVSGPCSQAHILPADVAQARWEPYEGVEEGSCERRVRECGGRNHRNQKEGCTRICFLV